MINKKQQVDPAIIILGLMLLLLMRRVFTGFDDVDEADNVFDIYQFLQNLALTRNFPELIWIDSGMNGPMHNYMYSIFTLPLSYLIGMPMDMAMRLVAIITIPFSGYFLYRSAYSLFGKRAALVFIIIIFTTPLFYYRNSTAVGDSWCTLFYALSLFFLTRNYSRKNVYLSLLFYALNLTCKYTFAPLFVLHLAIILRHWKTIQPRVKDIVFGGLLILCGFLPLGLSLLIQGPEFLDRFFQVKIEGILWWEKIPRVVIMLFHALGTAAALLFAAGLLHYIVKIFRAKKSFLKTALDNFFLLGFLAGTVAYMIIGTRSAIYVYPLVIPALMLTSNALVDLENRFFSKHSKLSTLLFTAVMISALFFNAFYTQPPSHREAARYVIEHTQEQDIVLGINSSSFYLFSLNPLVLNPLINTMERRDNDITIDYKMDGMRRLSINENVSYWIMNQGNAQKAMKLPLFNEIFIFETNINGFMIFKNLAWKPSGGKVRKFNYSDYSLKSIVDRILREGIRMPGEYLSEIQYGYL
ncbi:MAG: hypothetical protein B0D92_00875 [Spirochaeta sp. LUC14_002_19_P3]|nr:MAG: hypothetical protein B0D92_00875 [Spirochaeta sp. LUC14_002_19_P3]